MSMWVGYSKELTANAVVDVSSLSRREAGLPAAGSELPDNQKVCIIVRVTRYCPLWVSLHCGCSQ